MKKYYVNVRYEVVIPVEVIANDEDEAMDLAYDEVDEYSLNEGIISDPRI